MQGLRLGDENLESYVQFAIGYGSAVLLLCLVGLILNVGLLVIIYIRKQVRRSIYTTYMIQIAVTDAVVCVIWVILVALQLANLPSSNELSENYKEGNPNQDEKLPENEVKDETDEIFSEQRMFYAMYNFHFYNNIFLLAVMSVERCVAVMKSLRCQRYQFNKKFIYAASGAMWLLAFVLALPTFINPDLIVSPNPNSTQVYHSKLSHLLKCRKPLEQAESENSSDVKDCCGVTIDECFDLFLDYGNKEFNSIDYENNDSYMYSDIFDEAHNSDNYENIDYFSSDHSLTSSSSPASEEDLPQEKDLLPHNVESYGTLYYFTFQKFRLNLKRDHKSVNTCHPMLSSQATAYQIIANLVIGFFIPFLAIMVSNLAIAWVIRGRALSRLESDNVEEESLMGRRMSDFLRQFSHGLSRSEGESYRKSSPDGQRNNKSHRAENIYIRSLNENANGLNQEKTQKTASTAITFHPASPSTSPETNSSVKAREPRVRLSSLSAQFRRTSGGSGSSAESFLTEMTSLHTSSSPGVRLSAPLFVQTQDGRTLIQRACSADSSGTSGSYRPVIARRWSSEVFRSTINFDEGKKQVFADETKIKADNKENLSSDEKFHATAPPRSRSESTQALLDSQGRIYAPKQQKYNRSQSQQQSSRVRAYSAASRVSAGPGTSNSLPRQTIVYKHAVKQMKVSKTVLIYVVVFAVCWIPQRVVHFIYVTEGLVGKEGHFCNILTSIVRLVSFFSVLLNPIVYAVTQKELRHFLNRFFTRIYRFRKNIPKTKKTKRPQDETNERDPSASVMNRLTTNELSRMERHARNRERWVRMVHRLGPRSAWHSISASGASTYKKQSDGTIDEEREDEKDKSSKGQSSSNSFKGQISKGHSSSTSIKLNNVASEWEDWQQLIEMAKPNNIRAQSNGTAEAAL